MSYHRACCCPRGEWWHLTPCACDEGLPNLWTRDYDPGDGCVWAEYEGNCYTVCPDSQHKPELEGDDVKAEPPPVFTQADSHEDGCEQCCEPPIFDRCCDYQGKSECSIVDGPVSVEHRVYVLASGTAFYFRDPPPHCNLTYSVNDDRTFETEEDYGFCYQDSGPNLYTVDRIRDCNGQLKTGWTIKSTTIHFPWSDPIDTDFRCDQAGDNPFWFCQEASIAGPNFIEFEFDATSVYTFFGCSGTVTIGDNGFGAHFRLHGFGDGQGDDHVDGDTDVTVTRLMRGDCMHGASFTFDAFGHTLGRFPNGDRATEIEGRILVVVEYTAHDVGGCPPGGGRPGRRRFVSAEDFLQ